MSSIIMLISATLRMSTPLIYTALGGLLSEKSGVFNIALEGMMIMGAFFGVLGSYLTGSAWIGVAMAIAAGGLIALIHAFMCITMRAQQIIAGAAINLFAGGITSFLIYRIFNKGGATDIVNQLPFYVPQFIKDIPILGSIISEINWFVIFAFVVLIIENYVIYKTPTGLRIRATGEHPKAADTLGVNVTAIRYGAVIISGMLAGLGGASLSLSTTPLFVEGMVAGRGFIAIAAYVFGKWRPKESLIACMIFGFANALQIEARGFGWSLPSEFYSCLPYILTIITMILFSGKSQAPRGCGEAYVRESTK